MPHLAKPPPAAPESAAPRAQNNLRGATLLIAAMLIFTIEAAVIRWLGEAVDVVQAVFFRALGQFVVVFAWSAWRGRRPKLGSDRLGLHMLRGVLSVIGWWAYYLTFQKLPVALATLLTFASSLFVVLLAGPLLGEKVKAVSWVATIAGFIGIAIASDPSGQSAGPYVWVGLLSAMLSATIVFLTKALTQSEDTATIMAWIGIFVLPASAIVAMVMGWRPLPASSMAILLCAGTFGAFGMVLMIEAYGLAEAGVLAPIPYIRIAFAILFGYLAFGEQPSAAMLIGTGVVIASALYAMRAERR